MGKIYEDQPLPVVLNSDTSLEGAVAVYIDYRDNEGVEGRWNASLTGDFMAITYTIPKDTLKEGMWVLCGVSSSASGETPSTSVTFRVHKKNN